MYHCNISHINFNVLANINHDIGKQLAEKIYASVNFFDAEYTNDILRAQTSDLANLLDSHAVRSSKM